MTQALSLFDRGYLPMAVSTLHPERAANDPRGPRATEATEGTDSEENNAQEA